MMAGVAAQLAQPHRVRGRSVGAMLNGANLAAVTAAVKALPPTARDTLADLGFGGVGSAWTLLGQEAAASSASLGGCH